MSLGSSSAGASGSFSKLGAWGGFGGCPFLVNAPDLWMNSERADMPSLVPRISGRAMSLDTVSRISRCWVNLGHSWRMCDLVSRVPASQGHDVGSGDSGRNVRLNSPV